MFRSNKPQKVNIFSEGDGDDDDLFSGPSEKLASLFEEELPNKNPKSLKYVPPKQPSKDSATSAGLDNSPVEKNESNEANTVVLFATAVELFSYQEQETVGHGLVMCCIYYKKSNKNSVLLIYKSKESTITQADVNAYFHLTVQNDHYVSFTDASKKQWSLHLHGNKFEQFLFQVGICRVDSIFRNFSTSIYTQPLSYSKNGSPLKEGDCPRINFCSWQVENLKIGKLLDKSHEFIEVHLTKEDPSWKRGLIGFKPTQRYVIFVKENSGSSFNIVAYKVIFEEVETLETTIKSEVKSSDTPTKKESEKSKKEALISRMAKVGQPLLPSKPKNIKTSSSFPTDSESEDDPSFCHRYRSKNGFQSSRSSPSSSTEEPQPSSNKLTNQNVSTSSFVEEINTRRSNMTEGVGSSISDIPFHNVNQIPYYPTGRQQQTIPSGVPQGTFQHPLQGTVIAYQPQPVFQQPQQQLQNPPVHSSDPLLTLMFAESRSQNTDLRVALSQLTQKIDLVYSKIDAMDHHGTASLVTAGNSKSSPSDYDPQEFLKQITTMVEQLQSYKEKVTLKNERLEQLSQDYTQVLKKNQMLLEEKAELLSLKSEAFENKRESEMRIREMKVIEEQRISLEKELQHIKKETEEKKNFSEELESRVATLQEECKNLKLENTNINDAKYKLYDENQRLKSEILEIRKEAEETNEKLIQTYTEKLKNIDIENSNLKDEIKAKNKVESDLKHSLESQEQIIIELKKDLEVVKKKDIDTKSGKEKELECQLEKELNLNVEKDNQLKSKIELISQLESKLMKLQEEKLHPEKTSSATNTEIDSSGLSRIENDHKKIDVESVGKDIMNTAYRILKKGLSSKQMYNKQSVLDSVVDAFRETILKYTEEVESENAKVISEVKNVYQSREIISSMEENLTTKEPIEAQSETGTVNQYPETGAIVEKHLTAGNTNNDEVTKVAADYLENNSVAISPPTTNSSTDLPENEMNLVEKSEEVEPENSVKISSPAFSSEINTVLSYVEKSDPSSAIVDETPKFERKKISSNVPNENVYETPTSNISNDIKDDEDLTWKTGPPPPPPPLFSDSEDNDDWFT
ncbi:UNVERIFIED_CONTAM: hypothetical protein RMT77_013640 [Armadillidium vulgare]